MKFRYSLIINDPQIDEKHQFSPRIHPFQQLRMKIWAKWPTPMKLNWEFVASIFQMKKHYSGQLCWLGDLIKDAAVKLVGVRLPPISLIIISTIQGILKGEVSLYH
jgi:hypothetical protein